MLLVFKERCQPSSLIVKSSVGQTEWICCLEMTSVELRGPMFDGFHDGD